MLSRKSTLNKVNTILKKNTDPFRKGEITQSEFRNMLFTKAEQMIMDKKYRLREKQIDRINFKLLSDDKFRVKNDLIEFQIES